MDKPISMSVKDYLLRIMSVRTNTPERIIEAVVDHQFNGLLDAMTKPGVHSAEISGLGKFLFNHKKALKKWKKNEEKIKQCEELLKDESLIEQKRKSYILKLETLNKWRDNLKPKIDGIEQSYRGLEEQSITGRTDEGVDPNSIGSENENM